MSDMKFKEAERVSRRQAAERLIDLAYALTAGGPLELSAGGRRVKVPVAGELRLKRELRSTGDQVEFELGLTWSAPMHCCDDLASAAHRSGSD
jgi:amphi-Trp domain-containing protein